MLWNIPQGGSVEILRGILGLGSGKGSGVESGTGNCEIHWSPVGYADNKKDVLARLRRIEGQVRGLQRMVESDTYCIDVLTQVSATTKALESTALVLLDDHLTHCVVEAIAEGGETADAKIKEASNAIARLVRS